MDNPSKCSDLLTFLATITFIPGGLIFAAFWQRHQLIKKTWRNAARWLKLRLREHRWKGYRLMIGAIDGIEVQAESFSRWLHPPFTGVTRIQVGQQGIIPSSLRMKAESLVSRTQKSLGSDDILCGDEIVDRALLIRGDEVEAVAALDSATRDAALDVVGEGAWVQDGLVHLTLNRTLTNPAHIESLVRKMVTLARCLNVNAASVPERLLKNLNTDPEYPVRQRNLDLLFQHFPESMQAQKVKELASTSEDAQLRLIISCKLGSEGCGVLQQIALDPQLKLELRDEALQHLVPLLNEEQLRSLLAEFEKDPDAYRLYSAIATIRMRLGETVAGQLSLAEGDDREGALSLAPDADL